MKPLSAPSCQSKVVYRLCEAIPVKVKRTTTNGISTIIKMKTSLYCRCFLGKKKCMAAMSYENDLWH